MLDDLDCTGYENDIAQCKSNGWFNNDCTHREDVGVACSKYLVNVIVNMVKAVFHKDKHTHIYEYTSHYYYFRNSYDRSK